MPEAFMRYRVITNGTNLRVHREPDLKSGFVRALEWGQPVEVDEARSRPGWKKLADGGWAAARFLERDTDAPAPARDLLIFYGGWQEPHVLTRPGAWPMSGRVTSRWEMIGGQRMTRNDPKPPHRERSSYTAYNRIRTKFEPPSMSFDMDPSLSNSDGNGAVWQGSAYVLEHMSPGGRLVLYGFSAGGFNALHLARRIGRELPDVRVDLLITVDACLQRLSGHLGFDVRAPTPTVRRHVNFYQDVDEFKGRSMPALGDNNRNVSRCRLHDRMPIETADDVGLEITRALQRPASADRSPVPGVTNASPAP
jgi:hypothetical protein